MRLGGTSGARLHASLAGSAAYGSAEPNKGSVPNHLSPWASLAGAAPPVPHETRIVD
jgi:hypothetical protein